MVADEIKNVRKEVEKNMYDEGLSGFIGLYILASALLFCLAFAFIGKDCDYLNDDYNSPMEVISKGNGFIEYRDSETGVHYYRRYASWL